MDYDITAENLDGTPATCTREFRSKPPPTISPPPVHHSYKAIFCTWKSLVSRIQDIISRDREHGTPLYFIDTCFADVQFHENMIRISRPGIHFSGIETSASGWDQKFVAPEFAWFETFSKDSIPFGPLPGISSRIVEAGSLKTLKRIVEKCSVGGWKRKFLQGLIEWNLESDTVIGDMDIEKYQLEYWILFKFLPLDFIILRIEESVLKVRVSFEIRIYSRWLVNVSI